MPGDFAAQYPKNGKGHIVFPKDAPLRHTLWDDDAFVHPAKLNMYLFEEIVEYVSVPGQTILDPFGGIGTMMLATLKGRNVITIELNPEFYQMALNAWAKYFIPKAPTGMLIALSGDNRDYMPMSCDHIITSPPYGSTLNFTVKNEAQVDMFGGSKRAALAAEKYSADPRNYGNLNDFRYGIDINKLLKKCFDSLTPGGTLTWITQDLMRGGQREELANKSMLECVRVGFQFENWWKREQLGTGFKRSMVSKGIVCVDDEDIIQMRKPL